LEKVSKDQKSLEEAQIDSTPLSFFDPSNKSAGNSLRSLTTENGSFLYFQLLISVLLRMEPMFDWQKTTKNQLVQLCKENYKDNTDELKVLDEFDQTYTSSDAIRWYTRECCIYKLLNKALRFQDITMLVLFRFLISDIFDLLSKNTNEFFSSNQEIVFVYRGQLIGVEELNRIKAAVGEFISINSFLSTSRFRNVAFEFAMSSKNTDYLKRILFEIKIDININLPVDKPFADITKMTYFEREKEVLFMIGSMFKIESVQFNDDDDLWIASIALCSEDDYELRDEFKYMRTELVGKVDDEGDRPIATLNNLGNLLLKMGDVDEAEKCHEEMLVELQDEHYDNQDVAGTYIFAQLFRLTGLKQCYIGLRNVAYRRSNNDLGLEYENKAKEIGELLDNILGMIVGKTDDQSNSREPDHEKIARDHWNQNEYDLALENYEKQIEKYSKDGNNESLAECNYHAGCVCIDAEWWDQALKYLQPALDIRISILPKNHEDIANVHFKIGDTYRAKENYTEALEHLEKAYKIYILCLLPEDHKIVKVLSTICQTYYEQKNTTAALPYTNELLKILRKTNPEMAANLENLLHGNGNSQGLSDNVSE
jgi:tetratricopeptide (TPR) repeat protein